MFKKIMVPLDGSELAECVLPYVDDFIKQGQVESIVFVRVIRPVISPASFDDLSTEAATLLQRSYLLGMVSKRYPTCPLQSKFSFLFVKGTVMMTLSGGSTSRMTCLWVGTSGNILSHKESR